MFEHVLEVDIDFDKYERKRFRERSTIHRKLYSFSFSYANKDIRKNDLASEVVTKDKRRRIDRSLLYDVEKCDDQLRIRHLLSRIQAYLLV